MTASRPRRSALELAAVRSSRLTPRARVIGAAIVGAAGVSLGMRALDGGWLVVAALLVAVGLIAAAIGRGSWGFAATWIGGCAAAAVSWAGYVGDPEYGPGGAAFLLGLTAALIGAPYAGSFLVAAGLRRWAGRAWALALIALAAVLAGLAALGLTRVIVAPGAV